MRRRSFLKAVGAAIGAMTLSPMSVFAAPELFRMRGKRVVAPTFPMPVKKWETLLYMTPPMYEPTREHRLIDIGKA